MTPAKIFQRILITFLLVVAAFSGGYYFGQTGYEVNIRKDTKLVEVNNRAPQGNEDVDFALFWEVWDMMQQEYLLRPVDTEKMMYGAIEGMVSSLGDPYTSFLPPQENKDMTQALNGTYEGIGAELGIRENQLIVIAPLEGSPAKAAGIRSGDKILKIEDEGTIGISLSEAVSKIRGPAGTMIALTVVRDGSNEPITIRIKRGTITIDSVTWEEKEDNIAYIRVNRFGGETNNQWDKVAAQINVEMAELDAIVLDLRGNPGGYLQSAIYIAGEFFKDGVVVYEESSTGELTDYDTNRLGNFNDIPVVVLIDEGSASASEILAAALDFHVDAVLVGQKSFGKGTIQDSRDFKDGSGVHVTIAKWLTPAEVWVHEQGIEPDEKVEITEEDIKEQNDRQLEKALEIANNF